MAGTKEGGRKTRDKVIKKYGEDYYRNIGKKGGKVSSTGGFASNRKLASIAGSKGGKISKRGPAKLADYKLKYEEVEPSPGSWLDRFRRK